MKLFSTIVALGAAMLLSACGSDDQCAKASNPAECAQVAQAGGDVNDYLLYGMAGYMLSSAINGAGQRQPVIIADPNYHGYRRPIPSYAHSRDFVRRSTTTVTTTKRGVFGTRTTTRTSTFSSRPYRSSFRSRR